MGKKLSTLRESKTRPNTLLYKARCLAMAAIALLAGGCDQGPEMAPAGGTVYYNNEPLPYGSVMFQPARGQPATGQIQPDGTFKMSSFEPGDGATVGPNKVRVNCYSSQSPGEKAKPVIGERSIGALLIPRKYTSFYTSGLTADVQSGDNEPYVFRLEGPKKKFPK